MLYITIYKKEKEDAQNVWKRKVMRTVLVVNNINETNRFIHKKG